MGTTKESNPMGKTKKQKPQKGERRT